MTERLEIASRALQSILMGHILARPNAKPNPQVVSDQALLYADALIKQAKEPPAEPPLVD